MDFGWFEDVRDRMGLARASKPALAGLVAAAIVVAVVAAGRLIGTATATEFHVDAARDAAPVQEQAADDETRTVFVHVSGEVVSPGLYEVPEGSRVADAVQAAGGFTEDAATDSVNLARTLTDGEQVVVAAGEAPPQSGDDGGGAAAGAAVQSGMVNVNSASQSDLEGLPGIGPSTAAKIVADRQANGPFKTVQDLKRVPGIGDKKLEALQGLVCV